jgi:cobalt/nickel transport system permease protein
VRRGHGHGGGLHAVEAVALGHSPIHRLDARAKILALIGFVVVAVTTPPGAWRAFAAYGAVLAVLAAVAKLPPGYVLRRLVVEVPFLIAALVLVWVRGPADGLALAARVTTALLAAVVLSSTTPFPALLQGFERLRVPRLLLVIAAFMWRYLHVVGDEVDRMRVAREARGYRPRTLRQARLPLGGTVAALFIRSLERGERVHLAMTSRGYTGGMPTTVTAPRVLAPRDVAFAAALLAAALAARLLLP